MTYDKVARLNQKINSELLNDILNADYQFVGIESILDGGEIEVFDFTAEDDIHAGFINGILIHNCGKKKPEEMAKVKTMFLEGVEKVKVVTSKQGDEIFSWIEKSQRYSFNRCISNDTIIRRINKNRFSKDIGYTVEHLYRLVNDIQYAKQYGHLELHKKLHRLGNYGSALSLYDDGRIRKNIILDIQPSGKQLVYKVTLKNGSSIRVTENHKFPTLNGIKLLKNIKVGDELYICDQYEKTDNKKYNWSNVPAKIIKKNVSKHDHVTVGFMTGDKNPGYTNGSYSEYKKNNKIISKKCADCGETQKRLELHHINGDRTNSKLENLVRLCASCHKKREYKAGRTKKGEKGYPAILVPIINIEQDGECETYDVTMASPCHNFVTGSGIITCNSHAFSYGILGYICALLKMHFPLYFFTSWLSFAKEKQDPQEEIKNLINDAKRFDIEVFPPSFKRPRKNFSTDGKHIYFGFIDIKGIGEAQVEKIKSIDFTDINNWYDFLILKSGEINNKVLQNLIKVGALDQFKIPRQQMIFEHQIWNELTEKEQSWLLINSKVDNLLDGLKILQPTKKEGGGTHSKNRRIAVESLCKLLENPPNSLEDSILWKVSQERELLGIAISTEFESDYNSCKEFLNSKLSDFRLKVKLEGVVEKTIKKGVNSGRFMASLRITDGTVLLDNVVIFADAYESYKSLLYDDNEVIVFGKRSYNNNECLIINSVTQCGG